MDIESVKQGKGKSGENLYSLVESLERAHYFGHTYFDDEVTPFSILKELIQNPGVIYFGAHGNVDVLTTGVVIENTFTRGDIARHFRNAPEGMCLDSSLHPTSCVKLLDQKLEDDLNEKRKEFINEVKNKLGSKVSAAQAKEEVEETSQLIAGSPRPIPGGRFTFHDKPVAKKTK